MTKKAAKKKRSAKKAPKKVSTSGPKSGESKEESNEKESIAEKTSGQTPAGEKESTPEAKIQVVEESASEAEVAEPKKKMGRVPQPDGGRKRESSRSRSGGRRGSKRNSGPRPQVDQEELGKKAWKVFQQEIAEEGLALIDEVSARQLAEKSLAVTRAFLEERERRLLKVKPDENGEEKAEEKKVSKPDSEDEEVKSSEKVKETPPAEISDEEKPVVVDEE